MGGGEGTAAGPVSAATVIRPATVADAAGIGAIERASFGDPWSEASFRAMLGRDEVRAQLAVRGAEIHGYALAILLQDEAEIVNVAVSAAVRRQGIGANLLDHMLALLKAEGVQTVFLEVRAGNVAALRLYESRGFGEVGRRPKYYSKPVEDAVRMLRAATPSLMR